MALGLPRPREVAVLDLCRHRALDTVVTSCRQRLQNAIAFTGVGTLRRNPVLHRKVGELSLPWRSRYCCAHYLTAGGLRIAPEADGGPRWFQRDAGGSSHLARTHTPPRSRRHDQKSEDEHVTGVAPRVVSNIILYECSVLLRGKGACSPSPHGLQTLHPVRIHPSEQTFSRYPLQ